MTPVLRTLPLRESDGSTWNLEPCRGPSGNLLLCCDWGLLTLNPDFSYKILERFPSPATVTAAAAQSPSSDVVAICCRNGAVRVIDTRSHNSTLDLGSMSVCCDHVHCLGDGTGVLVQDGVSTVKLFDVRRPGRELLVVKQAESGCGLALRHRRFWVSEWGGFLVSQTGTGDGCGEGLGFWSIKTPNTCFRYSRFPEVFGADDAPGRDRIWAKLAGNGPCDGDSHLDDALIGLVGMICDYNTSTRNPGSPKAGDLFYSDIYD